MKGHKPRNEGFGLSKLTVTDKQRHLGITKYSCASATLETETSMVKSFTSIKFSLTNLV